MSAGLHDELDRLARQAPAGQAPEDLWRRGVVRRRRRRAGAAVGALVLVVAGGGLADVAVRSVTVGEDGPSATRPVLAVPTRVEDPSPWLRTGDGRSAGPLAVLFGAERRTVLGGSTIGLVGISARTGAYRFVDLPGQAGGARVEDASDPVLSPGGRWVAYWQGGRVASGQGARRVSGVVGVTAYDTVTGAVRRLALPSPLGIDPSALAWVDDGRLLVAAGRVRSRTSDGTSSRLLPTVEWSPAVDTSRRVAVPSPAVADLRATTSTVTSIRGRSLRVWDRDLRPTGRHRLTGLRGGEDVADGPVVTGRRVAAVTLSDDGGSRRRLVAGTLPASGHGPVRLQPVRLPVTAYGVLAWSDPGHVMVRGVADGAVGIYTVDVATGQAALAVSLATSNYSPLATFASSLWDRPPVPRPGPAAAPDPRLVALGGGAGALLALLLVSGLVRWRRALG
jgi:hypothetical protein